MMQDVDRPREPAIESNQYMNGGRETSAMATSRMGMGRRRGRRGLVDEVDVVDRPRPAILSERVEHRRTGGSCTPTHAPTHARTHARTRTCARSKRTWTEGIHFQRGRAHDEHARVHGMNRQTSFCLNKI